MADFQDLDPETRCFALVGQFLHAWSTMEKALHNAIGAALNIEATKLQILVANVRFRDKINILNTLIDIAPFLTRDEDKAPLKKRLRALAEYSGVRNMVAHDPFQPSAPNDGVEFNPIKAKGKFELPNIIWDITKFQEEVAIINSYRDFIEIIHDQFRMQPLPEQSYADALIPFQRRRGWRVPRQQQMSPALWVYLARQAEAPPSTDPPGPDAPVVSD
jgi:hypothetical protein